MKVLVIIDQFGWAFDFVARGIKKYSKHDVAIKRWNEINGRDKQFDCLFCLNDSVWHILSPRAKGVFNKTENKCVGIRGEEMPSDRILDGWKIGCVNKKIYGKLTEKDLPVKGIYLTQNGVDTEIFKPMERPENRFVVGWAGNPNQSLKRFHLLQQVNYPLLIQANYGEKYFRKGRSRDEMIRFYGKIDCFINVSVHEGMPQTLLEAATTKLPMVVTEVGGMPEFVDSEWVVPSTPEKVVIAKVNNKLQILKENPKLKMEIGEKNHQRVLMEWDWKIRVRQYDKMFEG